MLYSDYASIMSKLSKTIEIHGYTDDHVNKTSFHGGSTTSEIEEVNVMEKRSS